MNKEAKEYVFHLSLLWDFSGFSLAEGISELVLSFHVIACLLNCCV